MKELGAALGRCLRGGEVIELRGDVGAGKTTLVKGIGRGLRVDEDIQSPSFTLSRIYDGRDGLSLHHYDFYRLSEPGVMSYELAESIANPAAMTIVEWAETVAEVLPDSRCRITIVPTSDGQGRDVTLDFGIYEYLGGTQ